MIAVRMPDGSRLARRFNHQNQLQSVFDWVDIEGAGSGVVQLNGYALVTRMPRRVFRAAGLSSCSGRGFATLAEAGIEADTTLFVEPEL